MGGSRTNHIDLESSTLLCTYLLVKEGIKHCRCWLVAVLSFASVRATFVLE